MQLGIENVGPKSNIENDFNAFGPPTAFECTVNSFCFVLRAVFDSVQIGKVPQNYDEKQGRMPISNFKQQKPLYFWNVMSSSDLPIL